MKKYLPLILLVIIMLVLAACSSNKEAKTKLVTKYDIALSKAVRMGDITGKSKAPAADTTMVNKLRYRYEDEYMRTIWYASENGFELTLYNPSEKTMTILWEQGQYLDFDNIGHRLMISSRPDSQKEDPLPSISVAPRGNLVETIFSADHSSLSKLLGVYVRTPLLPTEFDSAARYLGKEMKLIIPVMVDNTTHNYEFTFKVTRVRQVTVKSGSFLGL